MQKDLWIFGSWESASFAPPKRPQSAPGSAAFSTPKRLPDHPHFSPKRPPGVGSEIKFLEAEFVFNCQRTN